MEYLASETVVAGVSAAVLHSSGYRPHTPEGLRVSVRGESVPLVSWQPVMCTQSYELWYSTTDTEETDSGESCTVNDKQQIDYAGNLTLTPGMTQDVALYGLRQQCGDYTVRLVAVTGAEFSNEVDVVFNICDNATETGGSGDITLDYTLEEDNCAAPEAECARPEPRQARHCQEDAQCSVASLMHISGLMLFSRIFLLIKI